MLWIWVSSFVFLISLGWALFHFPLEIFWNSDVLYLPALLTDVLRDGGSFRGWSLTPSPYFFPDLILVYLFGTFTPSYFWALICFAIFQSLLFVWVLGRFLRTLEPELPPEFSYSLSLLTGTFVLLLGEKFFALYLILLPTMHTSAFLISLWAWPYLFREKLPRYVFLPVLVLTAISDRILFLELFLPAGLAWIARYGRIGTLFPQFSIRFFLTGAISFGTYMALRSFLFIEAPGRISPVLSFSKWLGDLSRWIGEGQLPGIFILLSLFTGFWALSRSKAEGTGFAFAGFFQILLVICPPLVGLYIDEYSLRYSAPAFLITPALGISLMSSRTKERLSQKIFRNTVISVFITALFLYSFLSPTPSGSWQFKENVKPWEAECVDELVKDEHFVFVIADFWRAKRILVYSKEEIRALHVDYSTLQGSHTISNKEWYIFPPEGPIAVLPDGLGESRIVSFYGHPTKIVKCQNSEKSLWIYEPNQKIRELLVRPFQKTK
ncbi:hypothetical protein CH373_07555 [Leptospira perolatii]|uniref:Glycosyltransferase RgtA/B/C/D-like domain-containing protein n=1 Tax=Leptospira perolatii TaxID=2023191 RepID=A0A2M9ZQ28_9LEPT|nr:hypothetical protein [Leptospira perolatii]PJZ70945.1 hypothetical protein CH360_04415 [Leptospira perolatii]PJZ74071.1 hypothetical protein CH373_07555 [Leptospira perolatii]